MSEGTPVLTQTYRSPTVWKSAEVDVERATFHISEADVEELDAALRKVQVEGKELFEIGKQDFPLRHFSEKLAAVTEQITDGVGFALVKGLPLDRYSYKEASQIYWGIGRHMGQPMPQNATGDLLGHVRNTGRNYEDNDVRGYQTQARLPFHTDSADVVGLLCLHPALEGGTSFISSSGAVFNRVLEQRPDLAERMFEEYYWDFKEEQQPGADPYYKSTLAAYVDGKLHIRYVRSSLDRVARFSKGPNAADTELFDLIDKSASSDEFAISMDFQPGDMQFINNYAVFHSRSHYTEPPADTGKRRYLLRLWLNMGDGRRYPANFGRREGILQVRDSDRGATIRTD